MWKKFKDKAVKRLSGTAAFLLSEEDKKTTQSRVKRGSHAWACVQMSACHRWRTWLWDLSWLTRRYFLHEGSECSCCWHCFWRFLRASVTSAGTTQTVIYIITCSGCCQRGRAGLVAPTTWQRRQSSHCLVKVVWEHSFEEFEVKSFENPVVSLATKWVYASVTACTDLSKPKSASPQQHLHISNGFHPQMFLIISCSASTTRTPPPLHSMPPG